MAHDRLTCECSGASDSIDAFLSIGALWCTSRFACVPGHCCWDQLPIVCWVMVPKTQCPAECGDPPDDHAYLLCYL